MNKTNYKSDICSFYENFAAMSESRKVSPEEAEKAVLRDEDGDSIITETEKNLSLIRIAGQLGINNTSKLSYVAGLKEA